LYNTPEINGAQHVLLLAFYRTKTIPAASLVILQILVLFVTKFANALRRVSGVTVRRVFNSSSSS
jgi:hypothetical protein